MGHGHTLSVLQVPVWALNRTVLVRHATIIARRLHPIMRAQRLVTGREIDAGVATQVAERRRERVTAVLLISA